MLARFTSILPLVFISAGALDKEDPQEAIKAIENAGGIIAFDETLPTGR